MEITSIENYNNKDLDEDIKKSQVTIVFPLQIEDLSEIIKHLEKELDSVTVIQPPARGSGSMDFNYVDLINFFKNNADNGIVFITYLNYLKPVIKAIKKFIITKLYKEKKYISTKPQLYSIISNKNNIFSFRIPYYLSEKELAKALSKMGKFVNEFEKEVDCEGNMFYFEWDRKDEKYYQISY